MSTKKECKQLLKGGVLAKRKKSRGKVGSFYIPEVVREETQIAKVIKVSEGEDRIKENDLILYARHSGTEMPEFGDGITFFAIEDIQGVFSSDVDEG